MKILVTGANGYLGRGVVTELLNMGYQVIATDFLANEIDQRANTKAVNLFEVDSPYDYFEQPDVLVHMAWRDGFVHNSLSHIEDLPKHYHFVKMMAESGVKQMAVLGSMHEVGFFEGSITEATPTNPQSLYGISKNALRQSVDLLCREQGVVLQWLRGFYIVGNTSAGSSIFSKIVQAEERGERSFPFTNGLNQYDFLDYNKFCKYVAATVIQKEITGVINISSGIPEKLADRVERFICENQFKIKLEYGVFPDRPYDSKAVWGNSSKIDSIITLNHIKFNQ